MGVARAKQRIVTEKCPAGLYEDESLPGLRQLDLIGSDGEKRGILFISEEWVDKRLVKDLRQLLERHSKSRLTSLRLLRED